MAFDKKVTLQMKTQGYGTSGSSVTDQKSVWAKVTDLGVTTKYAAEAVGKSAELQLIMYRSEYDDYTHAVVDGTSYKISSTGRAKNDLHIKLVLERG